MDVDERRMVQRGRRWEEGLLMSVYRKGGRADQVTDVLACRSVIFTGFTYECVQPQVQTRFVCTSAPLKPPV